jgi:hypothetical protein
MALFAIRITNLRIPYKERELLNRVSKVVSWLAVKTSTRLTTRDANQPFLSVLRVVTVDQKHNFLKLLRLG